MVLNFWTQFLILKCKIIKNRWYPYFILSGIFSLLRIFLSDNITQTQLNHADPAIFINYAEILKLRQIIIIKEIGVEFVYWSTRKERGEGGKNNNKLF